MTLSTEPGLYEDQGISKPPTPLDRFLDKGTRWVALGFAVGTIALLIFVIYVIGRASVPAVRENGWGILTSNVWDTNRHNLDPPELDQFGLLPSILGTLYSSAIALIIATIFGVSIAIFLSQNFIPRKLEIIFKNIVELLAAIPSVVYGLWGIFVVIPFIRDHALNVNVIARAVGKWVPILGGQLSGPGMLPASLVLAIMVLPTISAISYDSLVSVSPNLKNAAMGLGATRWESIFRVILPTASRGIFGSIILAFGRALGETMALAMLLGNVQQFKWSLLAPGNTLAALIANHFPEADPGEKQVLLLAGMVLLAITLIVNVIGAGVIQFANRGNPGGRQ